MLVTGAPRGGRSFQDVASALTGELVQRLIQEYTREVNGMYEENVMLRGELQRVIELMTGYLDRERLLHDMLDKLNATYAQATAHLHATAAGESQNSDARRRQLADPMNDTANELQRIKQMLARPSALPSDVPVRIPAVPTSVSSVQSTPRASPRTPIPPQLVGGPFVGPPPQAVWQPPRAPTTAPLPTAELGLDLNNNGRADIIIRGTDWNRDGIPDMLQTGRPAIFQAAGPPLNPYSGAPTGRGPPFQPGCGGMGPIGVLPTMVTSLPPSVPGSPRPVTRPPMLMPPMMTPPMGPGRPPHIV